MRWVINPAGRVVDVNDKDYEKILKEQNCRPVPEDAVHPNPIEFTPRPVKEVEMGITPAYKEAINGLKEKLDRVTDISELSPEEQTELNKLKTPRGRPPKPTMKGIAKEEISCFGKYDGRAKECKKCKALDNCKIESKGKKAEAGTKRKAF